MKEIRFEIPEWVQEDEFANYIADNSDEYYAAFDSTANENDDRSQVDNISVINVELHENLVTIYYDVDYSAYHGCRDMNYEDTDEREIVGHREGRIIIFESFSPSPPRSTYEEF